MLNINITKRQKNIIAVILAIGAAYAVFIFFVYLPLRDEAARLKTEYEKTDSEIRHIKSMVGEGRSLEEAITVLKNRLDKLNGQFPAKEEDILKDMSGLAEKLGIQVDYMKPEKKTGIKEIKGAPVDIKGCEVQEMPVTISFRAYYKTMVPFIKAMKEDFPIYIKIDSVKIEKASDEKHPLLQVEMKVHSYLICQ